MTSIRSSLRGRRVAILAADGFELVELVLPREALRVAGAEIEVVSLHRGRIRGMNLTEPSRTVRVDRVLEEADPADYDALFVPGGFIGPDLLRQSREARELVRGFDAARKPIATLCHGPWLLVSADLVAGRTLSAWPGIRDDVVNAGGTWLDEPVVRDRNWVTSRGPQDLHAFIPAAIACFEAGAVVSPPGDGADVLEQRRDSSPRRERPIPIAVAAARLLPGPTLRTAAALALAAGAAAFAVRRAS